MKRDTIAFFCIRDGVNTGRYLEAAASRAGCAVERIDTLRGAGDGRGWRALIVVDPCLSSPGALRDMQCPVLGYVIDVHQQLEVRLRYARYFDYVFVAQPEYLRQFEALPHRNAHWLPLACDPQVHFVEGLPRDIDVGFVGKLGPPGSARHDTLRHVLSRFSTNDTGRAYTPAEMGAIYSRSKVVFNRSINGDVNMRFFEALASGALLVTDRIGNGLAQLGIDGEHFVSYETPEQAVDLVRHYLAHETERAAIAQRGQAHAFAHHTYDQRWRAIEGTVEAHGSAGAPARQAPPRQEALWRSQCLRLQGASLGEVGRLVGAGNWSGGLLANVAVAAARGVIRPLRRRLQSAARK
ncbi:CgeB family protein [Ramlibacter sp. PS4R-6]|uniref:CgeB family protein n=1 Tax=Ramlibacter sp. PS4R-6 TaxID=3133438 RepID=UPI0030A3BDD0